MTVSTLTTWAQGTTAALDRQRNGVVTQAQTVATLQQENDHLRHMLEEARARIRELEAGAAAPEELVTISKAAEIMQVHVSTMSRWAAAGHFQMRSIGGRKHAMIVAGSLHRPARKKRTRKV